MNVRSSLQKLKRGSYVVLAISLFIMALQLLSTSTGDLTPILEQLLKPYLESDLNTFGAGWIISYLTLNGTTGAAIGLSVFKNGLISGTQLLTMLAGSRFGAAFIVILIGIIEYLQGKSDSIKDSASIGIICFLIAYTVYFPSTLIAYFASKNLQLGYLAISGPAVLQNSILSIFKPLTGYIASITGPGLGFFLALGTLIVSLRIFGLAFNGLNAERLRGNYLQFLMGNKWISFTTGALLTLITTSVSLSLGIIVPLYNEGYIKRKEIIPYILGANLTTMISFIIAAMIVGTTAGMRQVLVLGLGILISTCVALVFYSRYFRFLQQVFDSIVRNRMVFGIFVVTLLFMPLIALLI